MLALHEWKQNADVVAPVYLTSRVAWEVEGYPVVIVFVRADAPDLDSLNRDGLLLVVVKAPALADAVFQRFARVWIFRR